MEEVKPGEAYRRQVVAIRQVAALINAWLDSMPAGECQQPGKEDASGSTCRQPVIVCGVRGYAGYPGDDEG